MYVWRLKVYLWAKDVGESFLGRNTEIGSDSELVEGFLSEHESLRSETQVSDVFLYSF